MKEYVDPIIKYPNNILRGISKPIEVVNEEVKDFTQMLLIVCKKQSGFGLSAPQVGKNVRIIVIDTKKCPLVDDYGIAPGDCSPTPTPRNYKRERNCYLINPIISNISTKEFKYKEGCLSIPRVNGWVSRPSSFDVTFQDVNGKVHTEHIQDTSKDVYGIIVQHEIDHLNGKLFIDKLNNFDMMKLTNKINKLRK
jgi:peptide deformylase